MPITVAPGRVEASLMRRGKAMANTAETTGERRWWIAPAGTVAVLAALGAPILAVERTDGRDDMALTRNEVMQEALGGRTWLGALTNLAGDARTGVSVHIRFHDRQGRPVGTPLSARAARLEPDEGLHLQARLPAEAAGLSIHALRWSAGDRTAEFGPGPPLAFGVLPDRGSHAAGLLPRRRNR